jgi:hypothetical protein
VTSTHSKHGEGATQAAVAVVPGRRSEDLHCQPGLAIQTVLFDSASVAVWVARYSLKAELIANLCNLTAWRSITLFRPLFEPDAMLLVGGKSSR